MGSTPEAIFADLRGSRKANAIMGVWDQNSRPARAGLCSFNGEIK